LSQVRKELRAKHGFTRGDKAFDVDAVFSREPQVYAQKDGSVSCERGESSDFRIDCNTGFGTASFVTGAFGLMAASQIVRKIAAGTSPCESQRDSVTKPRVASNANYSG